MAFAHDTEAYLRDLLVTAYGHTPRYRDAKVLAAEVAGILARPGGIAEVEGRLLADPEAALPDWIRDQLKGRNR